MLQEKRPETCDRITDLLESRRISSEFPAPFGRVRVETRIRISRPPWTLRTTVLRDGVEFQKKPLAPHEEQLEAGDLESGDLEQAREGFGRKALEVHDDFCRRVQSDLAAPAGGILASRRVEIHLPTPKQGFLVPGLVAVILILGGIVGFLLWALEPAKPKTAPARQAERSNAQPSGKPAEDSKVPSSPPKVESNKPKEEAPKVESEPAHAGKPAKKPGEAARLMETKPPVQAGKLEQRPQVKPEMEKPAPGPEPSVISDIDPSRYKVGRLRSGEMVYVDTDATFAEIPRSYQGLRCIRTADEDRTVERSLSFDLGQDARVYVLHDRRIGKRGKPDWLKSFTATGEHVTMNGPLGSGVVHLDVFVGDRPSGRVVLGQNTQWTSLTKVLRDKVATKDLSMYVVCVDPL